MSNVATPAEPKPKKTKVVKESVPKSRRPADPELESPTPTVKTPNTARFVYVPGSGTFAGDLKTWVKNDPDSPQWNALRKCPRLGGFLTQNPMAIVFADMTGEGGLNITQISMGGTFLPERTARGILPFLTWYGDEAKAAIKPVVSPDEEGKTLPKKK